MQINTNSLSKTAMSHTTVKNRLITQTMPIIIITMLIMVI